MIAVPVPKDLNRVKTKILFSLTQRQLLCFGSGALVGLPLYFALRGSAGNSGAAMAMIAAMLPFFFLALYEKNGRPPEKILWNMICVFFLRPGQRPYMTRNPYAALQRQYELEQEVSRIVGNAQKKPAVRQKKQTAGGPGQKADPGRTERN